MLVFYHIPKTAGTSVLDGAKVRFQGRMQRVLWERIEDGSGLEKLRAGTMRRETEFLSGHFGHGVHRWLGAGVETFTFLRDPLTHAPSMAVQWERKRRQPAGDLETLLRAEAAEAYFDNPHVRHLAPTTGQPMRGPLTRGHLEAARQHLQALHCFGLREMYAASLQLLAATIDLRIPVVRTNTSDGPQLPDLPASTVRLIWDKTELDRQLYAFARQLFIERLKALQAKRAADSTDYRDSTSQVLRSVVCEIR